ncbi:MAG: hypothetical protein ACSHX3_10640 [Litorimonas sp.]
MRPHLILSFIFVLCACQSDIERIEIENRFETVSEESEAAEIKELRTCIDDPDCATREKATAELGFIILSNVEQNECEWGADQNGMLVPVASDGKAETLDQTPSMSLDEWVAQGPDHARPLLIEDNFLKPYQYTCDFDNQSAEFQEGYDLLVEASAEGRKDATNEIGSLYINDPDLFDLAYARSIFEPCNAAGGGFCAFNLARIESLEADDNCGRCLGLLRIAAARTDDKGIRFMYALAKSRLDRGDVVGRVFFGLDTDSGTQSYLEEFDTLFPRLSLTAVP